MNRHLSKFIMRFFALFLAFFLFGGEPSEFGQENTFFHGYLIENPVIRVGLGIELGDVKVNSSSGMKVYEVKNAYTYELIKDDVDEFSVKGLTENSILYIIPNSLQSYLSYKERDYRGIFILRSSPKGIVLVNLLNLEDYLRSVVPSEMSPYSFNEMAAHKAQAVAARTYAIKNMGLKEDLGFDLYDTPRHQFYKGKNAEHPFSSEAVNSTRGEVALYNGRLIDALYTSSCGGRTEDVENIFRGPTLPYLKSTKCDYESQKEWVLNSQNTIRPVYIRGRNLSNEIATLISLEIIKKADDPIYYMGEISQEEVLSWTRNARSKTGKADVDFELYGERVNFHSFGDLIIAAFDWEEHIEIFSGESEREPLVLDELAPGAAKNNSLGYLVQNNIFPSQIEAPDLQKPLLRGEVIRCLYKALEHDNPLFYSGEFKSVEKDKIFVHSEGRDKELKLSPETFLMNKQAGGSSFVDQAFLFSGEKIRWIEREGVMLFLEIDHSSQADVWDRNSAYRSWKVRRTREQMEKRINRYYPVGELVDIVPKVLGESRRTVELSIMGKDGSAVSRGLEIRKVLGLKDTLFIIEREKDETGNITQFVISGRGWGHGVGLCQVGAYGMAKAGSDYKEILKKYYHGIEIKQIY